jgi:MFS family permease
MLNILSNRTYRHLFMAQVIALIGTGLATVALGLLAYDLAGDRAGAVLGTALAIKMSAYILVAPVAAAFADKFPRRTMLVTLDLVRALVAIALPFVTQIWEIYILIFFFSLPRRRLRQLSRRRSRIFFLTNANIPGRCLCHAWPTILKALSARCWRRRC